MPLKLEFFPEGIIALNKELATGLHPKLEVELAKEPMKEWEMKLARIAAYCGIVLDGDYGRMEIDQLGSILAGRLEVLRELPRAEIILPLH